MKSELYLASGSPSAASEKMLDPTSEAQRLASSLNALLKRFESLERRVARLEASRVSTASSAQTGSRDAPITQRLTPVPKQSAAARAVTAGREATGRAVAGAGRAAPVPTATAAGVGAGAMRVTASAQASDAPFPDLSLLDKKLEPPKSAAERIDARAALEDYPRIAARIQQLWGSPECEPYLNSLVIDTRGNRKGFPPAMMEELLYLSRLARALVILNIGGDPWDTYDQVGDRR